MYDDFNRRRDILQPNFGASMEKSATLFGRLPLKGSLTRLAYSNNLGIYLPRQAHMVHRRASEVYRLTWK